MHRSRSTTFLALVCALSLVSAAVPTVARAIEPAVIPSFTITGGGFGHGIGLSQYGSQGFALKGWTYDAIVKHYFQDTSIESMAKTLDVMVHLDKSASARSIWTIRGVDSTLTVYDGTQSKDLKRNTDYTVTSANGAVSLKDASGTVLFTTTAPLKCQPKGTLPLFQIKEPSGPFSWPFVRYRGKAQFSAVSTSSVLLTNMVPFEQYLYGVVPRESPASWRPEALKAQAVVARSYAKAKVDPNDDGVRDATLKCTTADQVYGGHSRLTWDFKKKQWVVTMHEDARTNAAVDATRDRIVRYGSTIVQTFFFSSSGGRTANIEDSWGYATPRPYYVGVEDPYEALAGSPHLSWKVTYTGLELASKLASSTTARTELSNHGLAPVPPGADSSVWVTGVRIERGVSGYPRWVTFRFSNGASVTLTSYTVKTALGLRSPNFTFTGFPMDRIAGSDRYDTAVRISKASFPTTAPAVVLASGEQFPDALAGSALAGATKGALLLTRSDELPSIVASEVARLKPSRIYVLGGPGAVATSVVDAVRAVRPSAETTRIAGADRYETAAKVAREVRRIAPRTKAIVVVGTDWADGVAASALAYAKAYPVLLTWGHALHPETDAYLREARPATTVLVGGTGVLSEVVATSAGMASGGSVVRRAGSDRYGTAADLARYAQQSESFVATDVIIATGEAYADALVGGMLGGLRANPLILSRKDSCPSATASYLRDNLLAIGHLWLLGGTGAISEVGQEAIDKVMMQ